MGRAAYGFTNSLRQQGLHSSSAAAVHLLALPCTVAASALTHNHACSKPDEEGQHALARGTQAVMMLPGAQVSNGNSCLPELCLLHAANLMRRASMPPLEARKPLAAGRRWLRSYFNGCAFKVFDTRVPPRLVQRTYLEIAEWLYRTSGLTLLGEHAAAACPSQSCTARLMYPGQ